MWYLLSSCRPSTRVHFWGQGGVTGSGNGIGKKSTQLPPERISKREPYQLPLIHPLNCGQPHPLPGSMFLLTLSPQARTTKGYRSFMGPEVSGRPELLLPQRIVGGHVCSSRKSKCPASGQELRLPRPLPSNTHW